MTITKEEQQAIDLTAIVTEANEATTKHGDFASAHEMYSVLQEEVDEVWDIVKLKRGKRNKKELRKELIQVAAMALKALDCLDKFVDY
jgi:NTP pyrophosphatase (non-canonical NTP hydrolase)